MALDIAAWILASCFVFLFGDYSQLNPQDVWRLIPYEVSDAATNMAIDEAILDAHLEGSSPPTLRLYGWSPPAISIGYGQKLSDRVAERIVSQGFGLVRRPTGGRAVLHQGELTYSFIASSGPASGSAVIQSSDHDECVVSDSVGARLPGSVIEAYKQICKGIILALTHLGIEVEIGAARGGYQSLEDCFAATTTADLHYRGKKMVGSAQMRRRNGVMQHGSILLEQSQGLMGSLLRGNAAESGGADVEERHANLFDVLDRKPTIDELSRAMREGFEEAFAVELIESELTERELQLVAELEPKYRWSMASAKERKESSPEHVIE